MSVFGGLILTNRGRNLQAKVQAGTPLKYTGVKLGDGALGTSNIADLTTLKNTVLSLPISKLKVMTGGRATIGFILKNNDLTSGFYFRELGVFAQDPDLGEILYCYGNAANLAEYIPAGGGADIVEKTVDLEILTGNASSVSAVIDNSLIFETPEGAQAKADAAEANAKNASTPIETFNAHSAKKASTTEYGHVMVGTGLSVNNGVISADIPELEASNVTTTQGTTVQSEIDTLKSSVSNGKISVRDAITGNGGAVLDADGDGIPSFSELVTGVNNVAGYNAQKPVPFNKVNFTQGIQVGVITLPYPLIAWAGLTFISYTDTHFIFKANNYILLIDRKTGVVFKSLIPNGNAEALTWIYHNRAEKMIYVMIQISSSYYIMKLNDTDLTTAYGPSAGISPVRYWPHIINGELWLVGNTAVYRHRLSDIGLIGTFGHGGSGAGRMYFKNNKVYISIGSGVVKSFDLNGTLVNTFGTSQTIADNRFVMSDDKWFVDENEYFYSIVYTGTKLKKSNPNGTQNFLITTTIANTYELHSFKGRMIIVAPDYYQEYNRDSTPYTARVDLPGSVPYYGLPVEEMDGFISPTFRNGSGYFNISLVTEKIKLI